MGIKIKHEDLEDVFAMWLNEDERLELSSSCELIAGRTHELAVKTEKPETKEELLKILEMVVLVQKQLDGLDDIVSIA